MIDGVPTPYYISQQEQPVKFEAVNKTVREISDKIAITREEALKFYG